MVTLCIATPPPTLGLENDPYFYYISKPMNLSFLSLAYFGLVRNELVSLSYLVILYTVFHLLHFSCAANSRFVTPYADIILLLQYESLYDPYVRCAVK